MHSGLDQQKGNFGFDSRSDLSQPLKGIRTDSGINAGTDHSTGTRTDIPTNIRTDSGIDISSDIRTDARIDSGSSIESGAPIDNAWAIGLARPWDGLTATRSTRDPL